MKHKAGGYQQIVLVVVRGVCKVGQIIIDLNHSHREPRTQWHINAPTDASSKRKTLPYSCYSASGVRAAQKHLGKGFWFTFPLEPGLPKFVTRSGQIRG
jgi:hypothetical protein